MTRTRNNPKRRVLAFLVAFLFLLTYVNPMAAFADEGSNQPGETVETSVESSEYSEPDEKISDEETTDENITEGVTESNEDVTEHPEDEDAENPDQNETDPDESVDLPGEPSEEEPVIEEPVIEEPVIEEPVIEEPVIEEPVLEQPAEVPVVVLPQEMTPVISEELPEIVDLSDSLIEEILNGESELYTAVDVSVGGMSMARGFNFFRNPQVTALPQEEEGIARFEIYNPNSFGKSFKIKNYDTWNSQSVWIPSRDSIIVSVPLTEFGNNDHIKLLWTEFFSIKFMVLEPLNELAEDDEYQVVLTKQWFNDNDHGTPISTNLEWYVTAYTDISMGADKYMEWTISNDNPSETITLPKGVAFKVYEDIVLTDEDEELIYYATGLGVYDDLGYIDYEDESNTTNNGAWTVGEDDIPVITVKNFIYAGSLTIYKSFKPVGARPLAGIEFKLIPYGYENPDDEEMYSMDPIIAETDSEGVAVFSNLVPGRYKLIELNNNAYDTEFVGYNDYITILKCENEEMDVINTMKTDPDDGDDDDDDDDDDDNDDNDDDNDDNDDNNNNDNDDEDDTETVDEEETPLAVPEITELEIVEDPQVPLAVPTVALVEVVNEATPLAAPMLPQTGGIAPELMYGLGALITAIGFRIRKK